MVQKVVLKYFNWFYSSHCVVRRFGSIRRSIDFLRLVDSDQIVGINLGAGWLGLSAISIIRLILWLGLWLLFLFLRFFWLLLFRFRLWLLLLGFLFLFIEATIPESAPEPVVDIVDNKPLAVYLGEHQRPFIIFGVDVDGLG